MAKIVKKGPARMAAKKPARSKSEAKRHAALDDTAPKGTPPDVNPVPTAEGSASGSQIHDADEGNGVKMPRGSQKPGKPALMSEKPDERLAQLEKLAIQHGWALTLPGEPLAESGE